MDHVEVFLKDNQGDLLYAEANNIDVSINMYANIIAICKDL